MPEEPLSAATAVDLRTIQERIMDALRDAQGNLERVDRERQTILEQIWRLRGQLDLTAEIAQQASRPPPVVG